MLTSTERWTPKTTSLTLDNLKSDQHPLFRYILTRNGHNVALYGGQKAAEFDMRDRARRFPADDWAVIDRHASPSNPSQEVNA